MTIHINQSYLRHNNPLAVESATLLVTEIYPPKDEPIAEKVAHYIFEMEGKTTYALIRPRLGLLAASIVMHEIEMESHAQTQIYDIAVRHEFQQQGYGRLLMEHIAGEAAALGDSFISLHPRDMEPYARFGFKGDEAIMTATPEDLLSSRQRVSTKS